MGIMYGIEQLTMIHRLPLPPFHLVLMMEHFPFTLRKIGRRGRRKEKKKKKSYINKVQLQPCQSVGLGFKGERSSLPSSKKNNDIRNESQIEGLGGVYGVQKQHL